MLPLTAIQSSPKETSESESDAAGAGAPTILNSPILQVDISRVPSIGSICVYRHVTIVTCSVHEDVADGNVARMGNEGVPELGLRPRQAIYEQVCRVIKRDGNGSAWLIAVVHVLIVPDLSYPHTQILQYVVSWAHTLAIQESLAVTSEGHIDSTKQPRC